MIENQIKKLGDVCEFYNGKAHEKSISETGNIKVINSKFVSSEGTSFKLTDEAKFPLYEGDICLVMSDVPNGKALAKCFLVDKNDTYSLNQRICAIRTDNFDLKFLFYQLNRHPYLLAFNNGENQTNLRKVDILNCPLWMPSMEEQKRIVAELDQVFADIECAKTIAEKNLNNSRKLYESYLHQIFNNKADDWEELTLKQASLDFGRGKSKHRPRNDPSLYGGKYPFIQTGDVRNSEHIITSFSKTYNDKGLSQSKLWPKGTICITIAANIAETGILNFDSCFPDSVIGIVADPDITSTKYVEFLLQSFKSILKAKGKGSAQDNINLGTFEKMTFPFPSITEQNAIVENLDKLMSSIIELESIYSRKILSLEELKNSILKKAFSGELTISKGAAA